MMSENGFFSFEPTLTTIDDVWNGLYIPRSNHVVGRTCHGLVLIRGDPRDYIFDDGPTLDASPGNILYIPKGSSYRLSDVSPCDCISINYAILEDISTPPFIYPVGNLMPSFSELFETADKYWNSRYPGYASKLKSLWYSVLFLMQKNYRPDYLPKRLSDRIADAVEYMNLNCCRGAVSVDELARMSDMSPVYFRRVFAKIYGMAPVKYISRLRIERAISLINSDMYPVNEVARLSGYSSEYYFSREFKRATGISPMKYRKREHPDKIIDLSGK